MENDLDSLDRATHGNPGQSLISDMIGVRGIPSGQYEGSQALGQLFGLPTTMTAFAFIGVAVTSATIVVFGEAVWDPVQLIARIGSPAVIIFGALVVLGNIDANGVEAEFAKESRRAPGTAAKIQCAVSGNMFFEKLRNIPERQVIRAREIEIRVGPGSLFVFVYVLKGIAHRSLLFVSSTDGKLHGERG